MTPSRPNLLLLLAILTTVSNPSVAERALPQTTIEGLQHVGDSRLALVYTQPGIDLGQYQRIYLDDTFVAFKKNWKRDQNKYRSNKIDNADMIEIKAELATLFREVFTAALESSGYQLTDEAGEDVLRIKPAIVNLDIIAPDISSPGSSSTYAESAGEMTLYLELYDSLTGDLIAKTLDREMDRKTGYFRWQNRVTNRAAARRILNVWAGVLVQGLDEARSARP